MSVASINGPKTIVQIMNRRQPEFVSPFAVGLKIVPLVEILCRVLQSVGAAGTENSPTKAV